jgi:hypothetical protein
LETDFWKTSECISWIFFDGVLKHAGTSFQGVSQCFPGKHGTSTVEFGRKPGEIKEKPPKKYIGLQLGVKL